MSKKRLIALFLGFFSLICLFGASTVSKSPATKSSRSKLKAIKRKESHIDPKVLALGLKAYKNAEKQGLTKNHKLTIIDYSKPSTEKRMWVIDMDKNTVPFYTYVAHGKNSGNVNPTNFSNQFNSKASSLGVYVTENNYIGSKGVALRLKGLEKGVNDNAMSRAVVIHGANYVSENFIKQTGRLGRSWGCPALELALAKPVIDTIKKGSIIFAYYPDKNWLSHSKYLT